VDRALGDFLRVGSRAAANLAHYLDRGVVAFVAITLSPHDRAGPRPGFIVPELLTWTAVRSRMMDDAPNAKFHL
jgi:hypothetical protein